MAKQAVKTADIGSWAAEKAAKKATKEAAQARKDALKGKSFTSMSRAEKDELLIELALRAGLLDDDGKGV